MRRIQQLRLAAAVVAALACSRDPVNGDVRYRLDVDNTWSEATHPGAFPEQAHFSWFGGATHNDEVSYWEIAELASPGIKQMAEDGSTFLLMDEVARGIRRGDTGTPLSYRWWICPEGTSGGSCGERTVEFVIDEATPFVTLVSMLGPSPDWFIGVSGLPLRDDGRWLRRVVVDLMPYDAGTRSANRWALFGPLSSPPEPITLITEQSGQLVGPGSLGTFTFTLLSTTFVRGDANADETIDVSDAVRVLFALFAGATLDCEDAADANDDGEIDVSDATHTLSFEFLDGPPPPAPYPEADVDPSLDSLSCS